jgi:fatty acid/phospholipid biosynthesis enzyme
VRGVCIIGHGSSNDRAIFNGIRVAYEFAKAGTVPVSSARLLCLKSGRKGLLAQISRFYSVTVEP